MKDARNLSKLLRSLPPKAFRDFLVNRFKLPFFGIRTRATLKVQRETINSVLSELEVQTRQDIEEIAEEIVLLSDGPGQDVVAGIRNSALNSKQKNEMSALKNQYERALWLFQNTQELFKAALYSRQADVFRQSPSCYSGYEAPKNLVFLDDDGARQTFHSAVARLLGCKKEDVAVEVFKRLRIGTDNEKDVNLYQVSAYYNRAPELEGYVKDSEVVSQEVIRFDTVHITYEPKNGNIEVLSKHTDHREELAKIAANCFLQSTIGGIKIVLKQYHLQSLAAPYSFDISGEPVSDVKVIELGCSRNNCSLLIKTWAKDNKKIYVAARSLIGPAFDFRDHHLDYAKLSVRVKKVGKERARTIYIILRDKNKCNIKTKREKDRVLCDDLLIKWGLVKEINDAA